MPFLVFFNGVGVILAMMAIAVFFAEGIILGRFGIRLSDWMLVPPGLTLSAGDLFVRYRLIYDEEPYLFHPKNGGHLMFVPAWAWGALLAIYSTYSALGGR